MNTLIGRTFSYQYRGREVIRKVLELIRGEGEPVYKLLHPAIKELRIGYLNSRCADLSRMLKEQGKDLFKRMIKVKDVNGEMVAVKEYSISPFIN